MKTVDTETFCDTSDTPLFVALIKELISVFEERDDLKATTEYQQSKIEQLQRELTTAVAKNGAPRPNRPKLTSVDAQNIRRWKSTSPGISLKTIARYYMVNKSTISRIIRGQYYKEAQ